jgi:hypothetical protein
MARRSRILVVHSDADWCATLCGSLGDELESLRAESAKDAWRFIDGSELDLVVAEEKVGVEFLEEISRRSPATARAILLNGGDRRTWVEAAAEGHVFASIPEHAPDLVPRLRALVATRAEPPRGLAACTVEIRAQGGKAVISGALLEITSDSLCVRIEPGDGLEHFLPGRELDQVVVRRGSTAIVDAAAAQVQRLRPDATGGYEILMALSSQRPAPAVRDDEVVRDPLQRASLVEEAIRRGQLSMDRSDGGATRALVRGRVDPLADMLLLDGVPPVFAPGCAVRFSFEAGGAHYRFFAALLAHRVPSGATQLAALLPAELRGKRRARPRVHLGADEAQVELTPPLGDSPIRRPALDVDMEGLGFLAQPGDLLPVGTRLSALRLLMADGTVLRVSGRIVSRAALEGGSGPRAVRCGVQLDPVAPDDQSLLAGTILRRTHPGLELARDLSFDALWCLLRETGFLYPEKEEKLLPAMGAIRPALAALLGHPHGPLRTLVFRGGGGVLQGHVSAVRVYRSTWMVQHLATRKGGAGTLAAAKALNAGVMEYLEQLPEAEWVRIWYRPKNRWPARTFGRFARLQFDPNRCDVRNYSYLVAPCDGAAEVPAPGVSIESASAADWAEIRRWFVARGDTALLASEDLSRTPDLTEVDDVYQALGLARRRETLVARRDGRLVAFALLELTSMGVNFSDLTSAFRMHPVVADAPALTALAARARLRYAAAGRLFAIGLAEQLDEAAWAAAGFEKVKEYCCMTAHRSLWRRYVEFAERLYEYAPQRFDRPKLAKDQSKPGR